MLAIFTFSLSTFLLKSFTMPFYYFNETLFICSYLCHLIIIPSTFLWYLLIIKWTDGYQKLITASCNTQGNHHKRFLWKILNYLSVNNVLCFGFWLLMLYSFATFYFLLSSLKCMLVTEKKRKGGNENPLEDRETYLSRKMPRII